MGRPNSVRLSFFFMFRVDLKDWTAFTKTLLVSVSVFCLFHFGNGLQKGGVHRHRAKSIISTLASHFSSWARPDWLDPVGLG
ncbi:Uncharacterized protein APZ42_032198 [Daphnia magna]|uniref:Uncharacterized protein n=1 Tax=Daphnia magna TaxID=35525 RepID=A0A164M8B2_9CRUS|nr:Uncharacterized protein APZ42_032198 [Daphnia magna]